MARTVTPGKTWYRMTNLAGDRSEVMLYDEIGAWGVTASDFVKDLQGIRAKHIDLRLNSPGGEVFDGLAIYAALKRHPADVTVHIDGLAASITSVIAMAGDQIHIDRHAQMMIHEAHAVAVGNTKDMTSMAKLLDDYSNTIASIYAERAGGTTEQWRERMKAETWFSAKEAVTAGLADAMAASPTAKVTAQMGGEWDLSLFNFAGRSAAPDPFAAGDTAPHALPAVSVPAAAAPAAVLEDATQPRCETCSGHADATPAAVLPFDPNQFRDLMHGLAFDAPAPPAATPRPLDLGPAAPGVPEPVPELPELNPWDQVRAAVRIAANNAPAPPQPNTTTDNPADNEPGFFMDASAFTTALRRAKL